MTVCTVVTAYSVFQKTDNPIFGRTATHVRVEDEAAGPFIVLEQTHEDIKPGQLQFELEELEAVLVVARKLIAQKA